MSIPARSTTSRLYRTRFPGQLTALITPPPGAALDAQRLVSGSRGGLEPSCRRSATWVARATLRSESPAAAARSVVYGLANWVPFLIANAQELVKRAVVRAPEARLKDCATLYFYAMRR